MEESPTSQWFLQVIDTVYQSHDRLLQRASSHPSNTNPPHSSPMTPVLNMIPHLLHTVLHRPVHDGLHILHRAIASQIHGKTLSPIVVRPTLHSDLHRPKFTQPPSSRLKQLIVHRRHGIEVVFNLLRQEIRLACRSWVVQIAVFGEMLEREWTAMQCW